MAAKEARTTRQVIDVNETKRTDANESAFYPEMDNFEFALAA